MISTTVPISIVDNATGHVSIMHFVTEECDLKTGEVRWQREASIENIEAELVKSGKVLANITWKQIDIADIPQDRTFRNAWRQNGKGVEVDLPAARDLARDKIRLRRDKVFPALDGESLRAMETGDQTALAAVAARKTKLRAAPADARLDAAKTPEELKASMEAIIGEFSA